MRQEVYDMMVWWLERGIDGFRMDVINMISKVPGLPDVQVGGDNRYHFGGQYFINGPRLLEFLGEMKQKVLSRYDILTVGETPLVTTRHGIELTNEETGALTMLFQFEHMDLDAGPHGKFSWREKPWSLLELKEIMTRWQKDLEHQGWNSIYLTNHDQPRAVSRFGDDGPYRVEAAKMLATFTHLLQGTPYIYQGEEIGMTNVAFESIEAYRDIETLNAYKELVHEKGHAPQDVLALIHARGRDNARTPIQWDGSAQAGFTTGTPWINVNPNYPTVNAQQALADPNSVFYYYQKLIQLRKTHPIFVYGTYDLLLGTHEEIYAFTRTLENERLLVILNFFANTPVFTLSEPFTFSRHELLISNYEISPNDNLRQFTLRSYEARVYRLI